MSTSVNQPIVPASAPFEKVAFGNIYAHAVGFEQTLEFLLQEALARRSGYVVTPNVDHVCLAEEDPRLVSAYEGALLSLADGMPLIWMAKALGLPVKEKISGSDLVEPFLARGAAHGLRVYFFGASDRVNAKAKAILEARYPGLQVVGASAPMVDLAQLDKLTPELERVRASEPHVVLFAFGCPKQELVMQRFAGTLPAVSLGIGATLDFIAGEVTRAPAWMSKIGMEWFYRLVQEPKRLAHRYLVRDRAIVRIFLRMARQRRR